MNRKELQESMKYIITLTTKEQWRYSIRLFKFLYLSKRPPHKKLKESYKDFLIYYNNNKYSSTKVAPFRAIMKTENRDLTNKI